MPANNNYQGYQNYDYNDGGYADYQQQTRNINLLEVGVVILALLALLGVMVWGFFAQSDTNKDNIKDFQIKQVILALDYFYLNSNTIPGNRAYPISECSQVLNETDYEFTLKQYLTGQRPKFSTYEYIKAAEFPIDAQGVYSQTVSERELQLRNCPGVYGNLTTSSQLIYADGTLSCNFNRRNTKYQRCYLYDSTSNGDKYEIGYYSESQKAFVVYSKSRDGALKVEIVSI